MFEVNQYAFPNWRMNEFDRASNYVAMAEGYKIGAIRLLDSLLDDNIGHDADAVIFPILFNAHQSLELYLKAAKVAVGEAKGLNPWLVDIRRSHNLLELIDSLNSSIPSSESRIISQKETKPLFDLIDLLKSVGDNGKGDYYFDFARYPEKQPGKPYVFVKDDSLVFNLDEVKCVVADGCDFLDGYCAMWLDRVDSVREMRAEV